eukprot:TRINITY_DN108718_c0_g1_i1.p1 TRINITY_DN108718_c0_g1~~TRINITY_DN108718_c0_g1_i1.p1  ORF type:complete len:169 (+),score=26.33 TRINITY_DN108718_c0_g1_i1:62-508(+)
MGCLDGEQWQTAIRNFEASLQLDPDFKAPWVNLGFAWLRLKNWDRAIEACDAGLYRHPHTPHCYYNKGLALYFKALDAEAQASGKHWEPNQHLRSEALKAFDEARANLERSAMWTERDDVLAEALRNSWARLLRPLSWEGWKFFGWRP